MRLLIAAGGTGGHVFPGLAIAEELRGQEPGSPILFVGTRAGLESKVVPAHGHALEFIEVSGLRRVGMSSFFRSLARLPRALLQSARIIRRFAPDVVVGIGGYASGPVVLMASLLGRPTVLAEPNSVPGFTNRILGRFARVVCVAFESAGLAFARSKVRITGNPVRRLIRRSSVVDAPEAHVAHVVIMGGSQGARGLNRIASGAVVRLARTFGRLRITHQTGTADLELHRAVYREAGVEVELTAFIDDVAGIYAAADLVIARAGATTVAELGVAGCPAVLVPFPHAADDHQWHNARPLADAGAALVLRESDLTSDKLADVVEALLRDGRRRAAMSNAMAGLGRPDAAARVLEECRRVARCA